MPLLKREPDMFPPELFDLPTELSWWIAHLRSRQEKAFARYLRPLGVPFYLPQHEKKARRSGRTRISFLPLFPGYLFFRGSLQDRLAALRSDYLVRVIAVPDQAQLHRELAQLQAFRRSGAHLSPWPDIEAGDAVRVAEGPFRGYRGVVLRNKGNLRLVVSVSVLRKSVSIEFERDNLAAVLQPEGPSLRGQSAVA